MITLAFECKRVSQEFDPLGQHWSKALACVRGVLPAVFKSVLFVD